MVWHRTREWLEEKQLNSRRMALRAFPARRPPPRDLCLSSSCITIHGMTSTGFPTPARHTHTARSKERKATELSHQLPPTLVYTHKHCEITTFDGKVLELFQEVEVREEDIGVQHEVQFALHMCEQRQSGGT